MKNCVAVGIFAHVDAGKTTLSEQLLYLSGTLRSAGRVDHGNTALDTDAIERERGITVFSNQAEFCWRDEPFVLMDTPGHVDFAAEAERNLPVLDMAILLTDGSREVNMHTLSLARMICGAGLPMLIFVNKADLPGFDLQRTVKRLEERLQLPLVECPGGCPDPEQLSLLDDAFCEAYLSGETEGAMETLSRLFAAAEAVPVLSGAALAGTGTESLLDLLSMLAPRLRGKFGLPDEPLSARVYRVRREAGGERVTFLRILRGRLSPRDTFVFGDSTEKVQQIRRYNGSACSRIQEANPGDAVGVTGLSVPRCGELLQGDGLGPSEDRLRSQPMLSVRVLPPDGTSSVLLLEKLRLLEDEDPMLSVQWDSEKAQATVRVMGQVQEEVLSQLLLNRFGLRCEMLPPMVLYRETLAEPVVGCGHYEPLKHYAEAHLLLSPAPRGEGVTFSSKCHVDDLPAPYQSLIRTHVLEKQHRGVLRGAPLTDVRVTLLSGRMHLKHTEGGDFREAVYRGIRQGLMKGKSQLLEPFYRFSVLLPSELLGRVMNDVTAMNGSLDEPEIIGEMVLVCGRAPVRSMLDYPVKLRSFSHGKGEIQLENGGYDLCAVDLPTDYSPDGDRENPSGSVFCSHGAGYFVPWDEADSHMHLPVEHPE